MNQKLTHIQLFMLLLLILQSGSMAIAQSADLVVIDKNFTQNSKLLAQLPPNTAILNLDTSKNPWMMIREKLESNPDLKNIHLFAESLDNAILVGGIEYTTAKIEGESELSMLEGLYNGTHYQLLLYTCNLSSNPEGLDLIKKIGERAYFNVAVSTNCTDIFNAINFDFTSLNQPSVAPILTN